ncbi:unannotated protein [freshwater metagenome]|uniref:Unannotated protein n=1 Tax=freshwater metagenome TaxID=449393 RepID=A0A6J7QCP3_9ZZZZ
MDLENIDALTECGERHHDLAVEAARAKKRWVKYIRAVGGRHHDDALGGLKPVHLGEHLVEGLLALVMTSADTGTALAAD